MSLPRDRLQGFHWKVSLQAVQTLVTPEHAKSMSTTEKLSLLDEYGFIYWPQSRDGSGGGFPRFKRYLSRGVSVQDTIIDISPINSQAEERLGYPTQKPEALLERILKVSSNEDSVVLDPFCGCGTAIAVAERLHRPWIGIDITHIAINLIRHRLFNAFGDRAVYKIIGEPTSLHDARALAQQDRYQFQSWALGLVRARSEVQKKGRDRGIDGRLFFHDEGPTGKTKEIIFSVKSGNTGPGDVCDLRGVVEREEAAIGVFITLHESTRDMRSEAATAGFYFSPGWNQQYPKLQILTVSELGSPGE